MVKLYALGILLILQTESNLAMETETRGIKRPVSVISGLTAFPAPKSNRGIESIKPSATKRPVSQISAPAPSSPSKVLRSTNDASYTIYSDTHISRLL